MKRNIGGMLDYHALALLHRPTDADGLRAAAAEMAARGLKPRDIATHLALTELAVSALLQSPAIAFRQVQR